MMNEETDFKIIDYENEQYLGREIEVDIFEWMIGKKIEF